MSRYPQPMCMGCFRKVDWTEPICNECHEALKEMRQLRSEVRRHYPHTASMSDVELMRTLLNRCIQLSGVVETTEARTSKKTKSKNQ